MPWPPLPSLKAGGLGMQGCCLQCCLAAGSGCSEVKLAPHRQGLGHCWSLAVLWTTGKQLHSAMGWAMCTVPLGMPFRILGMASSPPRARAFGLFIVINTPHKIYHFNFVSMHFTGGKYILTAMQPSPHPAPELFHLQI